MVTTRNEQPSPRSTDEEKEARFQLARAVYERAPKLNLLDAISVDDQRDEWQREIYRKVLLGIPDWYRWPRDLRHVYVMLPTHGCDPDGIESIAETLKTPYERLQKRIDQNESFARALANYRETGRYPEVLWRTNTSSLRHSELVWTLTAEAAIVSGIIVERELTAAGAMKLMERLGNLDTMPKAHRQRRKPAAASAGLDIFRGA